MALALKLKKLARMSPQELAFRLRENLRTREEGKRYPRELAAARSDQCDFFTPRCDEILHALRAREWPRSRDGQPWIRRLPVPLNMEKAERFKKQFPAAYRSSIERAERFLRHEFAFLGIDVHYPAEIAWQCDPVSGKPFPQGFYRDIDIFANADPGTDIKHVWEINRLQFLAEIAKAYYLTGAERFRREVERLVANWFEKNPYKSGVNWTSALEVGVRAFSLLWTLNFYLARGEANERTLRLLLKLLYLSGAYIEDNLSIYFSPYNHLIGEVAALFAIGYLFPGFKQAARWEKTGWAILEDQVEKQFHADGGCVEQATFYHHFTLGFYLQCVNARCLNDDAVPARLLQQLEKALEFALRLTRPDRTLPWLGDIDAARSLTFSFPAHWDFTGFQSIGAAWFGRGDMRWLAGELSEEAFWLLPLEKHEKFAAIEPQPPQNTAYRMPESGYSVFRSGWSAQDHFSLIDCGPIAAGLFADGTPSAAHGHADLLAIEIAPFGESLLIDPGFSNYRGEIDWHRYFRSTLAHNTLEIDGASQLQQVGILNWCQAPRFAALQQFSGEVAAVFCGEHYGYHRLPGKPTHRRYFLFVENTFWLTLDWVYAGTPGREHRIRQPFHFNESATVQAKDGGRVLLVRGQRAKLAIYRFARGATADALTIETGGPTPEQGWICPTYRDRRPAPVAVAAMDARLPLHLLTLYLPAQRDELSPAVSEADGEIQIGIAGKTYSIRMPEVADNSASERLRLTAPHRGKAVVLTGDATAVGRPSSNGRQDGFILEIETK